MSRAKASFSHLPLSLFQASLARTLHFHIFHFQILRDVSRESFVFTSSTFTFSGKSCTKCVLELQFLLCFATRSADCIVVAASRFLGAAAMCVVLLSFAARHRKPYLSGCIKAAIMICQQIFLILALVIFLFKVPFKRCSKIVYHPSFH